ncbi:MAG: TIGR01620 family protein [Hyphomicrobiaceae bacterium]|nr:TIGR01620 family protein [Hyphomicrobiaceae bacterium]
MTSTPPRKPMVFAADDPAITTTPPDEPTRPDVSGNDDGPDGGGRLEQGRARTFEGAPAPVAREPRGGRWGALFLTAIGGLVALAAGLWVSDAVAAIIWREDALGWTARGLAAVAALAAVVLVGREITGLFRLRWMTALRRDADTALRSGDEAVARSVVRRLKQAAAGQRDQRWDLERFREEERHMRGADQLLGLADRVLLAQADAEARRVVYQSARRVGVVSAVVPIAFIVVIFVLIENLRMVRRIAAAYGGSPGVLGGLRLFVWIIGHIAATGAIALTDDLWGQFFGQDLLRRVSARLGEGAFNGAMTARLGVAAIGVCRPLPFIEASPPRARHIFAEAFPDLRPAEIAKKVWSRKSAAGPETVD